MMTHCDTCRKALIEVGSQDSPGTRAAMIISAGYIVKNPVLYTGTSKWVAFCGTSCKDAYYGTEVGVKAEVQKKLSALRDKIPQLVAATRDEMIRFTEVLAEQFGREPGLTAGHMSRARQKDKTAQAQQHNPFHSFRSPGEEDPGVSGSRFQWFTM